MESKRKSIFRVDRDKKNPYITVNKKFVTDKNLSWQAKGLLLYMLSKPDDWEFKKQEIVRNSKDGIKCLRNIFKELIEAGYVYEEMYKDEKGRYAGIITNIYEVPHRHNPSSQNPNIPKPCSLKVDSENRGLLNNDYSNKTLLQKNDKTKSKVDFVDQSVFGVDVFSNSSNWQPGESRHKSRVCDESDRNWDGKQGAPELEYRKQKIQNDYRRAQSQVGEVFDHWKVVMNHPNAKLDDKRKRFITNALRSYSFDSLKKAIEGCKKTPFNMGDNAHGRVYDDICLIFRDSSHIETFLRHYDMPPKGKPKNLDEERRNAFNEISKDFSRKMGPGGEYEHIMKKYESPEEELARKINDFNRKKEIGLIS